MFEWVIHLIGQCLIGEALRYKRSISGILSYICNIMVCIPTEQTMQIITNVFQGPSCPKQVYNRSQSYNKW